jgi:hypothetical protein
VQRVRFVVADRVGRALDVGHEPVDILPAPRPRTLRPGWCSQVLEPLPEHGELLAALAHVLGRKQLELACVIGWPLEGDRSATAPRATHRTGGVIKASPCEAISSTLTKTKSVVWAEL